MTNELWKGATLASSMVALSTLSAVASWGLVSHQRSLAAWIVFGCFFCLALSGCAFKIREGAPGMARLLLRGGWAGFSFVYGAIYALIYVEAARSKQGPSDFFWRMAWISCELIAVMIGAMLLFYVGLLALSKNPRSKFSKLKEKTTVKDRLMLILHQLGMPIAAAVELASLAMWPAINAKRSIQAMRPESLGQFAGLDLVLEKDGLAQDRVPAIALLTEEAKAREKGSHKGWAALVVRGAALPFVALVRGVEKAAAIDKSVIYLGGVALLILCLTNLEAAVAFRSVADLSVSKAFYSLGKSAFGAELGGALRDAGQRLAATQQELVKKEIPVLLFIRAFPAGVVAGVAAFFAAVMLNEAVFLAVTRALENGRKVDAAVFKGLEKDGLASSKGRWRFDEHWTKKQRAAFRRLSITRVSERQRGPLPAAWGRKKEAAWKSVSGVWAAAAKLYSEYEGVMKGDEPIPSQRKDKG
jgi:hypothetical protein